MRKELRRIGHRTKLNRRCKRACDSHYSQVAQQTAHAMIHVNAVPITRQPTRGESYCQQERHLRKERRPDFSDLSVCVLIQSYCASLTRQDAVDVAEGLAGCELRQHLSACCGRAHVLNEVPLVTRCTRRQSSGRRQSRQRQQRYSCSVVCVSANPPTDPETDPLGPAAIMITPLPDSCKIPPPVHAAAKPALGSVAPADPPPRQEASSSQPESPEPDAAAASESDESSGRLVGAAGAGL